MNRVTECRCKVEKVRGLWNVMLVVEYDGGEFCETERLELAEPAAGPAALGMAVETIATAAAQLADRHGIGQADCEWIDSLSALTDTEGRGSGSVEGWQEPPAATTDEGGDLNG